MTKRRKTRNSIARGRARGTERRNTAKQEEEREETA